MQPKEIILSGEEIMPPNVNDEKRIPEERN